MNSSGSLVFSCTKRRSRGGNTEGCGANAGDERKAQGTQGCNVVRVQAAQGCGACARTGTQGRCWRVHNRPHTKGAGMGTRGECFT